MEAIMKADCGMPESMSRLNTFLTDRDNSTEYIAQTC